MDEAQKTELRNYTMSAGFFVIAVWYLIELIYPLSGIALRTYGPVLDSIGPITAVILILIGVILVTLRKRDLTAVTFIFVGMANIVFIIDSGFTAAPSIVLGSFMFILSMIMLMGRDSKRYILFIIPALIGIKIFVLPLLGVLSPVVILLKVLIFAVAFYCALSCVSERVTLPFSKLLTSDATTDFKSIGSAVGYLLISISSVFWCTYYFFGESFFDFEGALAVDMVCGSMLVFAGVLLAIVAKMRFTPIVFILTGFLIYIGSLISGPVNFAIGGMFVVLGIMILLRKEQRFTMAIMILLLAVAYLLPAVFGEMVSPVFGSVNLAVGLISLYMASAVFCREKLPLF